MVELMDNLMDDYLVDLMATMKAVYSVEMMALMKADYSVETTDDYLVVLLDDQTVVEMVD